jgi:ABC-type Zn uptake system ZnuABC Zn-binding protein ZnuA
LLESTGSQDKLVDLSQGITLLPFNIQGETGSASSGDDPHTWMDPNNVILWTQTIASALGKADPAHAADYQANAEVYAASLRDLDAWIRSEVTQVPPAKRLLVSDHAVLGYFAAQYGFTQVGTITGSFSSEAAPSARELAALEDTIRKDGVPALFLSEASNQTLADQVAADTSIRVVWIYHATLTGPNGPASTYLDFMRYNVAAITNALR